MTSASEDHFFATPGVSQTPNTLAPLRTHQLQASFPCQAPLLSMHHQLRPLYGAHFPQLSEIPATQMPLLGERDVTGPVLAAAPVPLLGKSDVTGPALAAAPVPPLGERDVTDPVLAAAPVSLLGESDFTGPVLTSPGYHLGCYSYTAPQFAAFPMLTAAEGDHHRAVLCSGQIIPYGVSPYDTAPLLGAPPVFGAAPVLATRGNQLASAVAKSLTPSGVGGGSIHDPYTVALSPALARHQLQFSPWWPFHSDDDDDGQIQELEKKVSKVLRLLQQEKKTEHATKTEVSDLASSVEALTSSEHATKTAVSDLASSVEALVSSEHATKTAVSDLASSVEQDHTKIDKKLVNIDAKEVETKQAANELFRQSAEIRKVQNDTERNILASVLTLGSVSVERVDLKDPDAKLGERFKQLFKYKGGYKICVTKGPLKTPVVQFFTVAPHVKHDQVHPALTPDGVIDIAFEVKDNAKLAIDLCRLQDGKKKAVFGIRGEFNITTGRLHNGAPVTSDEEEPTVVDASTELVLDDFETYYKVMSSAYEPPFGGGISGHCAVMFRLKRNVADLFEKELRPEKVIFY